jgi:hypothetical protein
LSECKKECKTLPKRGFTLMDGCDIITLEESLKIENSRLLGGYENDYQQK